MGARDCINNKAAAGIVTQDQAKAASDLYDEQLAELKRKNTPDPESAAEQATLAGLRRQALAKKKAAIATLRAQEAIRARIEGTRGDASAAALSLLDFDPRGKFHGPNVVQMGHDIENQALARMEDMLKRFRTRFANVDKLPTAARESRRATMRDIARELFGEQTGSQEASALAKGVSDAFEYLRGMFNASGGSIQKLERWGLPQNWSRRLLAGITEPGLESLGPAAVRARKAQIWADSIIPGLDRERMTDFNTGLPLTDPTLRKLVTDTYEEVVTGGLSDLKPGMNIGTNLATRRQQSRFLIFKDADSWLDAQAKWSGENVFDTIINHVRSMSRDTALMRVLGPNPSASAAYVEKLIASEAGQTALESVGAKAARAAGDALGVPSRFRRNFDLVTGRLDQPDNSTFAAIDETNRNVTYSAVLGGAVFTVISDRGITWATANLLGVPQGRVLARFLKMLNPASIADQQLALRVGFGAEDMAGAAIAQARYTGELLNPSVSRTLADTVTRASGLVRLTTSGRQAFQIEFLGELTRLRGVAFDDLPQGTRNAFALHGVTPADWNTFRALDPWKDPVSGAQFLRPHDLVGDAAQLDPGPLFDHNFEVANKIMGMINAERDFAVPGVSTRARADLLAGTHPGSATGFLTRNILSLKSWPLSLMYNHLNRALYSKLPGMTRAKFMAQLVIGATVWGALGEQMHQIAQGKDPMDMTNHDFWAKSAARGGGVGIFGDFLFNDQNHFGQNIWDAAAGPIFGREVPALARVTIGAGQEAVTEQGRENLSNNYGKELLDFSKLLTPGRSLWYSQLAMDRLVYDTIQEQIDPNYGESFSRAEQRAMQETGQQYFSPPGTGFPPPRAPNPAAALGAQ
jgi:hypothetical protein